MIDSRRKKTKAEINMTPMIDCVFLLLIFFMVATSFAPIPGIRVKLPPPGMPQSSQTPQNLILRISDPETTAFGVMVLNDNIISMDRLLIAFQAATLKQKEMLIIQSGRSVLHDQIVQVMDLAKRADIKKIGFAMVAREGI
ncbi:TPA: biopolymer transporter ExbD [bacterium]|nr:biopolymer transporter ExbD [bacterium]